ncbi:hypothetical protein [Streptomyces sp. NRRL B-1347]|uniref:hypothetical protein n=1 Tax=Streptomyces sp. NRRL B-1347 TaxID=1476877 RepID=UPI000690CF12|nr:hypothetical protein [Streptomyces sp. NRRL B-1347]
MALLHREQFPVQIERFLLWLQEAGEDAIDDWPEDADGLVSAQHGRVDIKSGGHTHTAAFTVEVWDSPPEPDPNASWEATGEAELESPTGQLQFHTAGGPDETVIALGVRDQRWRVRAHVVGQEQVAALAEQGVPHGVERFLLQFWPV